MDLWWRVRDSTSPPHEISRISQVWPCLRRPRTAPQSGFASIGVNGFRRSETASDRRGEAAPGCQVHLLRLLPFLFGGHRQLALENLALRHQLAVYKRTVTRPRLCRTDRFFWVTLARVWAGWRQPLAIVTPDTVLRWQGGAASASTGPGSPADPPEGARPSTPRSKSWSCEWPPPTRSGARRESTASSSSSAAT